MRFSLKLQDHSGLFIWLHRLYEFHPVGGLRPGKRMTLKVTASVLMVRARNPETFMVRPGLISDTSLSAAHLVSERCPDTNTQAMSAGKHCIVCIQWKNSIKVQLSDHSTSPPAHSALHPALQTCRSVHLENRTSLPTFPALPILDLPDYSSFFRAQLTPHPPGPSWPHGNTCLCLGLPGTCKFMLFPHFSL